MKKQLIELFAVLFMVLGNAGACWLAAWMMQITPVHVMLGGLIGLLTTMCVAIVGSSLVPTTIPTPTFNGQDVGKLVRTIAEPLDEATIVVHPTVMDDLLATHDEPYEPTEVVVCLKEGLPQETIDKLQQEWRTTGAVFLPPDTFVVTIDGEQLQDIDTVSVTLAGDDHETTT